MTAMPSGTTRGQKLGGRHDGLSEGALSAPRATDTHAEATDPTRSILDSIRDLNTLLAESPVSPGERRDTIAESPCMRDIIGRATRIAASKATVLIEGESGTGKELLARLIHFASPRAAAPFVSVNCAALSEGLIESELFGHERGAFTGATDSRPGRFEIASGGTLLLDEISEMPLKLQAKLLRVLEEGEFERVGGSRTLRVDVRVIATSNRDLLSEVRQNAFRHDLFYRLNVMCLRVPPLRSRREDIAPLVTYFIWKHRNEASVPIRGIAAEALEKLFHCDWPGNVRQLRNVIYHACVHARAEEIQPQDLPTLDSAGNPEPRAPATLEEVEREVILRTLRELDGNKTAAAIRLGVTPRTLLNKMNRYRQLGLA
jgi:DNA-binding NtrC family response regulator